MTDIIDMSICTYNDGLFEVMIKNDKGEEIILEGKRKLTSEEFELVNDVAPACVYTRYKRIN